MELLVLGGLLLIIMSMLITSSKRYSQDDSLEYVYVMKGLALALLVVGAFDIGRWLLA